jgi:hypothetical protein
LQGFRSGVADDRDQQYARICADMQRFGNFGAEVPEIAKAGFIRLKGSTAGLEGCIGLALLRVGRKFIKSYETIGSAQGHPCS